MPHSDGDKIAPVLTLKILQVIKEAQQHHGLRHGDYQRYRGYCSRKLRRLRKSMHITNVQKSGDLKRKKFSPDNATDDSRFLVFWLFEAERCWAYSMQLKQESNTEPRKRFHAISRLKRATDHSRRLKNLCCKSSEFHVEAATKLEAQAYDSWLKGCLHFELQSWSKAQAHFVASKTIYMQLSDASSVLVEQQQQKNSDVYQERCQDALEPQLRYCAFKIGDDSAAADLLQMRLTMTTDRLGGLALSDIDQLIAQTREKQVEQLKSEIVWCNYNVNWSKAPNKVKGFYANLKQFETQLSKTENVDAKISLYDQLIGDCRDACQIIKDENKNEDFNVETSTDDINDNRSVPLQSPLTEIQVLYFWLINTRLSKTMEKYLLLINSQSTNATSSKHDNKTESENGWLKPNRPLDVVRLYDVVLQNLNEILGLPGIRNDVKYVTDLTRQIVFFKTIRCYYIAETFAIQRKWREALALYCRCISCCDEFLKDVEKHKLSHPYIKLDLIRELNKTVNARRLIAHASCVSGNQTETKHAVPIPTVGEKIYAEDFETYCRLNVQDLIGPKRTVQLTRLPPVDFKPTPCKPIFFDLALNHLTFPSLEDKIATDTQKMDKMNQDQSKALEQQQPSDQSVGRTGFGNIVKGWFWSS